MSYSWIKFYHEILHDPKMARLSDHLWRRVAECFLMAGEEGDDGRLPPPSEMAWILRTTEPKLLSDLEKLSLDGIVQQTEDGWIVTNFKKRQAANSVHDRVTQYRERKRKENYYSTEEKQPVTEDVTTRYTDKTREDKDKTTAQKTRGNPELFALATAIAEVCQMDLEANKGRLMKEAKLLSKATPTPTPELLRQYYNGSSEGFWRTKDWRGKKGQVPNPANIRETWGKWGIKPVDDFLAGTLTPEEGEALGRKAHGLE